MKKIVTPWRPKVEAVCTSEDQNEDGPEIVRWRIVSEICAINTNKKAKKRTASMDSSKRSGFLTTLSSLTTLQSK